MYPFSTNLFLCHLVKMDKRKLLSNKYNVLGYSPLRVPKIN